MKLTVGNIVFDATPQTTPIAWETQRPIRFLGDVSKRTGPKCPTCGTRFVQGETCCEWCDAETND